MSVLKNKGVLAVAIAFFAVSTGNVTFAQDTPAPQQQMPAQAPVKEDFKKEELQSFVKANQKVVAIQRASEEEMIKVVKDEGFTVERFNEIAESQQNPDKKVEADEKELASFNSAAQKITGMSQQVDGQMQESIKQEGLDIETYQQIILAYQSSDKVKQEIDALLPQQEENQQ